VVQVGKNTFEDLTPAGLEKILDAFLAGKPPAPGSRIGRRASCPVTGPTSLTDPTLYDGSTIGAWKARFEQTAGAESAAVEASPASALASPAHKAEVAEGVSPSSPGAAPKTKAEAQPAVHPAALTAMANAGLVKELEARGTGKPLSAGELDKIKTDMQLKSVQAPAAPELLSQPRSGKADDLSLIWGVADRMVEKLNAIGIWHFDQIAKWSAADIAWFESKLEGFKGRVTRDKWIEQANKLASGWRPDSKAGERPKD
jgi:NADH-quinone oxidoreductase subunit E